MLLRTGLLLSVTESERRAQGVAAAATPLAQAQIYARQTESAASKARVDDLLRLAALFQQLAANLQDLLIQLGIAHVAAHWLAAPLAQAQIYARQTESAASKARVDELELAQLSANNLRQLRQRIADFAGAILLLLRLAALFQQLAANLQDLCASDRERCQ
jgi:hypothetical protein